MKKWIASDFLNNSIWKIKYEYICIDIFGATLEYMIDLHKHIFIQQVVVAMYCQTLRLGSSLRWFTMILIVTYF